MLRLEVLTPANLGSAAGEASLDRPTQKEAFHGLPFVPDSALKGVLAGQRGDLDDERPNPGREELYGAPDRPGVPGRPGPLVLGNGELLSFPLRWGEGRRARVFPAAHLARFLWLEDAEEEHADALDQLRAVEEGGGRCLALPPVPALLEGLGLSGSPLPADATLPRLLRRYGGAGLPQEDVLLVVARERAGELWRDAAERRTLTALAPLARTVRAGSLRTVELMPPGTQFLSLVSVVAAKPLATVPEVFQLGAWESQGLGWITLSGVVPPGAEEEGPWELALEASAAEVDELSLMVESHRAMEDLARAAPPWLASVRSAVGDFGPRTQRSGLEAALAFEIAKAKPQEAEPKGEACAHRWLVAALLGLGGEPAGLATGPHSDLLRWLRDQGFTAGPVSRFRPEVLTRWLWLRRFGELALAGEAP